MSLLNLLKHPSKLCLNPSINDDSTESHIHPMKRQQRHRSMRSLITKYRLKRGARSTSSCRPDDKNSPNTNPMVTVSQLSKSISNHSVTFASIFDDSFDEAMNVKDSLVRRETSVIQSLLSVCQSIEFGLWNTSRRWRSRSRRSWQTPRRWY